MSARVRTTGLYLAAGAVYVAIGLVEPRFLLSWVTAAVYLVLVVCGLPAAVRCLMR